MNIGILVQSQHIRPPPAPEGPEYYRLLGDRNAPLAGAILHLKDRNDRARERHYAGAPPPSDAWRRFSGQWGIGNGWYGSAPV